MSNNQWNSGQSDGQWPQQQGSGDWNAAPQPGAPEWNQDNQAAGAQDWNAPGTKGWGGAGAGQPGQGEWPAPQQGQDWNAGAQSQPSAADWQAAPQPQGGAQPQPSATDWNAGAQPQPSATDWNAGAQPQPSATDWNQQQGWGAGAPGHQGWDQNQQGWDQAQQAGHGAPAYGQQQQWQQPVQPKTPSAFANIFDFSFKKFALPEAGGTIFLIAVIAIAVKWVFDLAYLLTYAADAVNVLQVLIGGLATSLLYVLLVRVFLEGMTALVTRSKQDAEPKEDHDPDVVA
ncbi:DUF4282 domain-containing protein [Tessaracoccus antarcticus]|uniref:DUF4282 domain-containing protein n=1 Tax=Tessaracoccus antarcticus TaxID=2479848 RepID=A0A3M0G8M2_9ACTN|nr:DUF4282 domain-containing protein [Tessaracoccus antarcticus]RMB61264.1 hypothetical protein EAX62_00910 [Tessaracoccus antarcticus]